MHYGTRFKWPLLIQSSLRSTQRPRLVRLISPINATVHDLLLIDSPKFHFVFDFGVNIEVYHLTIRGGNLGTYDGIDAIGTNYWVHVSPKARTVVPSSSEIDANHVIWQDNEVQTTCI